MTSFAAAGFAKGFATGFINERNRRLDEQKSKDEITLRYQLEALSNQKEDWKKKQEQEQKYIDSAKFVSGQVNNPAFAAVALEYVKNGYDPSDVIKMYQNGEFEQVKPVSQTIEVDNPEQIANKHKITGAKVPEGVQPVSMTPLPNIDVKTDPKTAVTPAVQTADQTAQMPSLKADPETLERLERVNKDIDGIDPTLRTFTETNKKPTLPENILKEGSTFKYLGPKKKIELEDYGTELLKLEQAKESGDKLLEAEQTKRVRIHRQMMAEKARAEARAKGDLYSNKAILDKDGYLQDIVVYDDEKGVNRATGKDVTLAEGQRTVDLDDNTVKHLQDLQDKYQKPKEDYDLQKSLAVETIQLGRTIHEIATKKGNEHLNTDAAGVLSTVDRAFANVEGFKEMFQKQWGDATVKRQELDKLIKDGASAEMFSTELGKFEALARATEKTVLDNLPHSGLSPELQQQALDRVRLENAKLLMAYKVAMSFGQTAGKMSNQDFQIAKKLVGDEAHSKNGLLSIVYEQLLTQRGRVDTAARNLKNSIDQRALTVPGGVKLPIGGERLGDFFQKEYERTGDRRDLDFFNALENNFNRVKNYTNDEMARSRLEAQTQQQEDLPTVYSPEEAMKLSPGTWFYNEKGEKLQVPPQ